MTHLSHLFPLNNEFVLWPVYGLDNLRCDFCQVQDFSLFQNIHTTAGAQPVSYSMGTSNYFPLSKSGWLGYETGHSTACSSKVMNKWSTHLLSPYACMLCKGKTLSLTIYISLVKIITTETCYYITFFFFNWHCNPCGLWPAQLSSSILSRKGFTECCCQQHVKPPTWRTSD